VYGDLNVGFEIFIDNKEVSPAPFLVGREKLFCLLVFQF
jgi:hypothetical protein